MVKRDRAWWPSEVDHDWIDSISPLPHSVLVEMEAVAAPEGIPILGRDSGRILAVLAAGRSRIIEVGTAIGYSTLCMALAQPPGGTIVTIDPDRGRTARAREFWRRAGVREDAIAVVDAPALEAFEREMPALAGPFDLVFIDALKSEYAAYLDALRHRLSPGALVVADNVLWSGRTSGARPSRIGDGTAELREFCTGVLNDPAFSGTILPVGDGLLVAVFAGDRRS